MKPRYYQSDCVRAIWDYFSSGQLGDPLCELPTAAGKSVVIALFVQSVLQAFPKQRIVIVTDVKELVEQNSQKLLAVWAEAPMGIYSAGLGRKDTGYGVTFCGIDSVDSKPYVLGHVDLVLVDEAHMVDPKNDSRYQKFFTGLRAINPYMRVVGFTATPWRAGIGHICSPGGSFTKTCYSNIALDEFNRLINEGFLCPLIPMPTDIELDVTGVRTTAGDYNNKQLQEAVDKESITRAALNEAIEKCSDRNHWLIFGAGIEHCQHIQQYLNEAGKSCTIVHSKLTKKERDDNIAAFKAGKYDALVNMGVLTKGFDDPAIDLILMLRPTQSTVLWVQMLGRGVRIWPGKLNCMVLDYAGNTRRLGPINDPVLPKKRGEPKGGPAPIKNCPKCGMYNHASARFCAQCGEEFKFTVKIDAYAGHDELIKKQELPDIQVLKVDFIQYAPVNKVGKPPMMKVGYTCGLRVFNEWVCLEHDGYAAKMAREWHRLRRPGQEPPATTADALDLTGAYRVPTHIRVWLNKKFPEVKAVCFDGTAFAAQVDDGARPVTLNEEPTATYFDDVQF